MSLSLWVGKKRFEIGTASFLKSWFSTILAKLENDDWGSSFPIIMTDFYKGSLPYMKAEGAIKELINIHREFTKLSPDQVVWDFEKCDLQPPWGLQISPSITSLANYFVTSDGRDLFKILEQAFAEAAHEKRNVEIS